MLKMIVRKKEVIHEMFPKITIENKDFTMNQFVKRSSDNSVITTDTCLEQMEEDGTDVRLTSPYKFILY